MDIKRQLSFGLLLLLMSSGLVRAQETPLERGNHFYRDGDYTLAETAYREAIETDEQSFSARFNLGSTLYRQERYEAAIRVFKEASSRTTEPEDQADAWFNIGNAYRADQKPREALEAYRAALLRNPKHDRARHNMVKLMRELRNPPSEQEQENQEQNSDQQEQNQEQQNQEQQSGDQQEQQNQQEQSQNDQNGDQSEESGQDQQGNENRDSSQEDQRRDDGEDGNSSGNPDEQPMDETEGDNARKQQNERRNGEDESQMSENAAEEQANEEGEAMGQNGEANADPTGEESARAAAVQQLSMQELENLLEQAQREEAATLERVLRKTAPRKKNSNEKDW